jgi:hypothetical protein
MTNINCMLNSMHIWYIFSEKLHHKVHRIPRVPQCMSPRPNRDPPTSSPKRGGAHSPGGEGVGGPNSDDWRKSLALCLLCAITDLKAEECLKETKKPRQKYVIDFSVIKSCPFGSCILGKKRST